MPSSGWGSAPWGAFPWGLSGGATPSSAELSAAVPIRENVLQLFFTAELEVTGLLGTNDAGDPSHYVIRPVPGTKDQDGVPTRKVTAVLVESVEPGGSGIAGTILNLTLDRPMSSSPAQYTVEVQNLVTIDSIVLTPSNATAAFFGTQMPAPELTVAQALPTRDFAHPDTLEASLDPLPEAGDQAILGSFPVGSDGDYAADAGITNLKKRVFRRLTSTKGRFLHLGSAYGVGVQNHLKMLATAGVRQQIAADAQAQISQEPDVQKVVVRMLFDPLTPELTRIVVLVKPTAGRPVRFDAPFVQL